MELEVVRLVNIERQRAGVAPLAVSPTLMMAARFKAQSMTDMAYFAHENPVYGSFVNISRELFAYPVVSMGENIARWQQTPHAVVTSLMASPGHRANILRPSFTEIGVGFFSLRWAQKFSNGDTAHIDAPRYAPW